MPAFWYLLLTLAVAAPPTPVESDEYRILFLPGHIPAEFAPEFAPASEVVLDADELVVGIVRGERAQAYPLRPLRLRHIVNSAIDSVDIAVSHCALTGTSRVHQRGRARFEVSGSLYRNNMVIMDLRDSSLWSQLSQCSLDDKSSAALVDIPFSLVPWSVWKDRYPASQVWVEKDSVAFPLTHDQLDDYEWSARQGYFPSEPASGGPSFPRELIIGIVAGGETWAVPASLVDTEIVVNGVTVRRTGGGFECFDANGDLVTFTPSFWFAWADFYPESRVYGPERAYAGAKWRRPEAELFVTISDHPDRLYSAHNDFILALDYATRGRVKFEFAENLSGVSWEARDGEGTVIFSREVQLSPSERRDLGTALSGALK